MKNRQIGTFKEYLKEQKQQKLNESNVNIECDFWDACVAEVLKDLEEESCGFIDWNVLGDYIKTKFAILGRTWDEYIDNLYILEIKDLIWTHYGKSLCNCTTNDNAELHSKGVVVEALATEIYEKLSEKLGSEMTSSTIKIKVSDINYESAPDEEDDDYYVDLPTSYESRRVKKFKAYTKQLNEAAKKIERDNLDVCTAYCLDRIEKEAGSLAPDAVFDAAVKYATPQVKSRMVLLYVVPMVQEFLTSSEIIVVSDGGDSAASKEMAKQAIEDISYKMADDVLYALYKLNGGEEDAEVE